MIRSIPLYWNTVRHLRPVQLYGRILFRVRRPAPEPGPAPDRRPSRGEWRAPAPHQASIIGPRRFRFLNREETIGPREWDSPALPKLWRYNLHYFDDLTAPDAGDRNDQHRALVDAWMAEVPAGEGTGWEPYPTSLRIVNWIKWALGGASLSSAASASLATQARWLERRLEWHLLGNHLLSNAKALLFAGLFFEGPDADRWVRVATRIIAREIPEQVLADGAQFELSPMYHALAFEDVLDMINICRTFPPVGATEGLDGRLMPVAGRMGDWLTAMTHPDGEIAFFNDAAIGIAPPPAALHAYAGRLGVHARPAAHRRVSHLAPSGFVRLELPAAVCIVDVGHVGPAYLPAHAHADTLSFELSLFGQRVFVNSGTSLYDAGDERLRQRGTAAHNTLVVDGRDSTQVWSSFRVARRARPSGLVVHEDPAEVACAHDGYPGVEHRRAWRASAGRLEITDALTGRFARAAARLHLHPDVRARQSSDGIDLEFGAHRARVIVTGASTRLEDATWHPQFGVSVPSRVIVLTLTAPVATTRIEWHE